MKKEIWYFEYKTVGGEVGNSYDGGKLSTRQEVILKGAK